MLNNYDEALTALNGGAFLLGPEEPELECAFWIPSLFRVVLLLEGINDVFVGCSICDYENNSAGMHALIHENITNCISGCSSFIG